MVCSIQYGLGYSETSFGTLGRSLEYGQHPYDIDHESGVAYLVKCDWSIRKSGRDLGDGCKKISTFPEQISNLDWPPDWPSELPSDSGPSFDARNSGINLGIILFLIAVPIMVMFSTTANSFLSSTLGSLPLISKDAITRSHYSQWDVEKREIFRDATGIAGQGIIASVAGVIYATALLTAYVIYIVGVVVLYAIYAYLIISGVVLLALGYVAGIICFLPIILLAAIAG